MTALQYSLCYENITKEERNSIKMDYLFIYLFPVSVVLGIELGVYLGKNSTTNV